MISEAVFKNIADRIHRELSQANDSVYIAVAWFTNKKLFDQLILLAKNGCKINLMIVDDEVNKSSRINYDLLKDFKSHIYRISANEVDLMHNKFCIIDKKTVLNGSYNWSYKAEKNYENIIISYDNVQLARQFIKEFHKIRTSTQPIKEKNSLKNQRNQQLLRKLKKLEIDLNKLKMGKNDIEELVFEFSKRQIKDLRGPINLRFSPLESNELTINELDNDIKEFFEFNNLMEEFGEIKIKKTAVRLDWEKTEKLSKKELQDMIISFENYIRAVNSSIEELKKQDTFRLISDKDNWDTYFLNITELLKMDSI